MLIVTCALIFVVFSGIFYFRSICTSVHTHAVKSAARIHTIKSAAHTCAAKTLAVILLQALVFGVSTSAASARSAPLASNEVAQAETRTPRSSAATVKVDASYGETRVFDKPTPLFIEVSSDTLFVGELRITSDLDDATTKIPVNIPAATTRDFTAFVRMAQRDWSSVTRVKVELVDKAQNLVSITPVSLTSRPNTELVGVLPSLADADMPNQAKLSYNTGDALLFPIKPERLQNGWAVLAPLDIMLATKLDLTNLDTESLDALMGWVNRGGRLLIDEPIGTILENIPSDWLPTGTSPSIAGKGEVMLTGGLAAAGEWNKMFEPTPIDSYSEEAGLTESDLYDRQSARWSGDDLPPFVHALDSSSNSSSNMTIADSLFQYSNLHVPPGSSLFVLLVIYIAITVIGVWFASKRLERPALGWLVLPCAAFLLSSIIWFWGSQTRRGIKQAHGTVVEVAPQGTVAASYAMLYSSSGETKDVELPERWNPVPILTGGHEENSDETTVSPNLQGSTASLDIDAGEFRLFAASGNYPELDNALQIDATASTDERIAGSVTNNLDVDLHNAAILTNNSFYKLGSIPAGATVGFGFDLRTLNACWTADWRCSSRFSDDGEYTADSGIWRELHSFGANINKYPLGEIAVAASTEELDAPFSNESYDGTTVLTARSMIKQPNDSEVIKNPSVSRKVVRGPLSDLSFDPNFRNDNDSEAEGAIIRFVLHDNLNFSDDAPLVLSLPEGFHRVEMWHDTHEWRELKLKPEAVPEVAAGNLGVDGFFARPRPPAPLEDADVTNEALLKLPAEATANGRVYLRVFSTNRRVDGVETGFLEQKMVDIEVRSLQNNDRQTVDTWQPTVDAWLNPIGSEEPGGTLPSTLFDSLLGDSNTGLSGVIQDWTPFVSELFTIFGGSAFDSSLGGGLGLLNDLGLFNDLNWLGDGTDIFGNVEADTDRNTLDEMSIDDLLNILPAEEKQLLEEFLEERQSSGSQGAGQSSSLWGLDSSGLQRSADSPTLATPLPPPVPTTTQPSTWQNDLPTT